jgi:hypothetical protein
MKKVTRTKKAKPDMMTEYDFRGGVRGKYASRFAQGFTLVPIEPELAKVFPDPESVNDALRACVQIVRSGSRSQRAPKK